MSAMSNTFQEKTNRIEDQRVASNMNEFFKEKMADAYAQHSGATLAMA